MDRLEKRFKALEKGILDPKSVLHVDGLLVSLRCLSQREREGEMEDVWREQLSCCFTRL